jgi:hypothetical protein
MALGVTHKWPKAFPVIGFFRAESETQQARRCALSIDREPEQTHHWTVIQSGAVACGLGEESRSYGVPMFLVKRWALLPRDPSLRARPAHIPRSG